MILSKFRNIIFFYILLSVVKGERSAKMINNWKKAQYTELTEEEIKIKEWFEKGCLTANLKPRSSRKVVRQEYRTLTHEQRWYFHSCLKAMIDTPAVLPFWEQNEYESFITQHKFQFSPQAHGSPAFAPYHRALLYFFEKVLQSHPGCENVGIPYWDSTLDSYLPDPSMSAMFGGDTYMGTTHGKVKGKLFENWVPIKLKECHFYGETLSREMCRDPDQMMKDSMIEKFLNCHNYTNCVFPHDKTFEENHGLIHGCVNGHMAELMCSPYDPIFFLHHTFIDLIFSEWLEKHFPDLDNDDPASAYPPDDTIEEYYNRGSAPMRPFDKSGYLVKDGMSRNFTRDFYWYAPRPFKCSQDLDCHSDMIWCDVLQNRCKAKAGVNGSCEGLPDKACYCSGDLIPICLKSNNTCQCVQSIHFNEISSRNIIEETTTTTATTATTTTKTTKESKKTLTPTVQALQHREEAQFIDLEDGTPEKNLPQTIHMCKNNDDCKEDEYCNGICEKRVGVGGACHSKQACVGSRAFSDLFQPCQQNEDVQCVDGKCHCKVRNMICTEADDFKCPENFYCAKSLGKCYQKGKPNRRCDKFEPYSSCGYCGRGYNGLCLRRVSRCFCVKEITWFYLKRYWQ